MKALTLGLIAAAATVGFASAADANVQVIVQPGCAVYCGPTPITYDFETPATTPIFLGGAVVGPGTNPFHFAQPLGSTGMYYSVGPSTSTPGNITIGNNIGSFSFIWGSIDTYNTLVLNTMAGSYTFTGAAISAMIPGPGNGNQTAANTNPIVTFLLTGNDQFAVNFNMSSLQNAFEIDDIAVNGVPEPATWAMMLLGFGAIGIGLRRRKPALAQLA